MDVQSRWKKLKPLLTGHKARMIMVWLGAVALYQWYAWRHNLTPVQLLEQIADSLRTGYGPLIYMVIYAFLPLILFPVSVISLLGGWVFGITWGIIYTLIGSSLSASVAYVVGWWFGKNINFDELNQSGAGRWLHRMRSEPFLAVLMLRLLFVPYDLVNYAAGCMRLRWFMFWLATMIGAMPGMLAIILAGASIEGSLSDGELHIQPWTIAVSLTIMLVSIVISRVLARRSQTTEPEEQALAFDALSTD